MSIAPSSLYSIVKTDFCCSRVLFCLGKICFRYNYSSFVESKMLLCFPWQVVQMKREDCSSIDVKADM